MNEAETTVLTERRAIAQRIIEVSSEYNGK